MNTLPTLISALEQAQGASRELDKAIALCLGYEVKDVFEGQEPRPSLSGLIYGKPGEKTKTPVPHWTSSIDAALTLVPEGWSWRVQSEYGNEALGVLANDDCRFAISHKQPVLAFCIAALKAREQKESHV